MGRILWLFENEPKLASAMQNLFQPPFVIPHYLLPLHLGVLWRLIIVISKSVISKSLIPSLLNLLTMCLLHFYKGDHFFPGFRVQYVWDFCYFPSISTNYNSQFLLWFFYTPSSPLPVSLPYYAWQMRLNERAGCWPLIIHKLQMNVELCNAVVLYWFKKD